MNSTVQISDYVKTLEAAIFVAHNVWPIHKGTCFVWEETEENAVAWAGPVELFGLPGHDKAKNCFAWQHKDDHGHVKILIVLESPFIDSAKKAIEAAIYMNLQPVLPTRPYTLELLKKRLLKADRTLHEAQIKAENLDANIQSVKESMDKINDRLCNAFFTSQQRELHSAKFSENQ